MPTFTVLRRVDAYVDYTAEVDTAAEAAKSARSDEDRYSRDGRGECQFDARLFVTLDKHGCEIDETQVGDF